MIIDGRFELYNVDALFEQDGKMQISRLPLDVREGMLPSGHDVASISATGSEIRFVMNEGCDQVKLHIHCLEPFMLMQLYFGSFQGGWEYLHIRGLFPGDNVVVIDRPKNIDQLREVAKERGHIFSPDVMRLCLRSGKIADVWMEGDARPPRQDEVPSQYALFYGSSITHGSLAYLPCQDYASQVCMKMGVDLLNKGFAGSCRLEKAVVDHLTSLPTPAFAVFELGSNIPGDESAEQFESEVNYLLSTYTKAHPETKIFVIDDLLVLHEDHEQRHEQARRCIEKQQSPNLVYLNGHHMLPKADLIAADFTHPTVEGHRVMADVLLAEIRKHL